MYPILFELGDFRVRSYGVIVDWSFLLALWSTREANSKGIDPKLVQDFALYAFLGGIIGARLYFVLFSEPAYFLEHPGEVFAIWTGGMGIIGSLLGGLLVAAWFCRKHSIPFLRLGDTLAPGWLSGKPRDSLPASNGDSYGRPTDLPWAITFTDPRSLAPLNIPLHPIELYEMAAYFFWYFFWSGK